MFTKLAFVYTIRRSHRATRVRIVVSGAHVEVVAPLKTSEKNIIAFVESKQQWIMSALQKIAAKPKPDETVKPVVYTEGATIHYQGQGYTLTLKSSQLKRVKIDFAQGFTAHIPEGLNARTCSDAIKLSLENWMKKETLRLSRHWVEYHGSKKQLLPRSINIRTQKSRWGSCGIHNDIQINWLLVMAPPEVLEYVVVHELCHIQVRNHSARFWDLVAEHLPNHSSARQWLKLQGGQLMRGL